MSTDGLNKNTRMMFKYLKANGYEMVRGRKHLIFKNKDGRIIVVSNTSSDYRSWKNTIRDYKSQLRQSQAVM